MLKAYKKFWEGYADFTGYSTVSEYWWPHFIHLLITMPLFYALIQLQIDPNDVSAYQMIYSLRPLYSVFGLVIFLPSLTLSVLASKRCRITLVISSCWAYSLRRLVFHASIYDLTNKSR